MYKIRVIFIFYSCFILSTTIRAQPRLVVPVGHGDYISKIGYSADSRFIATVGADYTIKVWFSADGALYQTLLGHKESITEAELSERGKYLSSYSISDSISARVWDVSTGKTIISEGTRNGIKANQLIISPSERFVARSISGDIDIISLQNVNSIDPLLRQSKNHSRIPFDRLVFSRDDKFLLAGCSFISDSIYLYDLKQRSLIKKFRNHGHGLQQIIISPNSKFLGLYNNDTLAIVDFVTGRDIYQTSIKDSRGFPSFSADGNFLNRLTHDSTGFAVFSSIDLHTSKEISYRFAIQPTRFFNGSVSPDGEQFRIVTDKGIFAYKRQAGKINPSFSVPIRNDQYILGTSFDEPVRAVFSPDNKRVALYHYTNNSTVYDMNGELRFNLSGSINFDPMVVDEEGSRLVYAIEDSLLSSSLISGELNASFKDIHLEKNRNSLLEGSRLYAREDNQTGQHYVEYQDKRINLSNRDETTSNFAYLSPGARYIVSFGYSDSLVQILDAHSGVILHSIQSKFNHRNRRVYFNSNGTAVTLSEYNNRDLSTSNSIRELEYHISVIELATCKTIFDHADRASEYYGQSAKGEFIDSSRHFVTIADKFIIWETNGWKKIFETTNPSSAYWGNASCSKDNKVLLCFGNAVSLYEAFTNKFEYALPGEFVYARFSSDGKYILTQSPDNLIKVWKTSTGDLQYTYFAFKDDNFLVMDKYGRYDGTEIAKKKLYYVCGDEVVQLDQVKELGWQPGLAGKITGADPNPIVAEKISEIEICGQTPIVEKVGSKDGVYHYKIMPRAGGLGEVQIYLVVDGNEKLMKTISPAKLIKAGSNYTLQVNKKEFEQFLVGGSTNELSVRATTRDKNMISRGGTVAVVSEKKSISNPNVYLLSVGVSQYKSNDLQLFYASKDANDFANAMNSSAKKLLNTDGNEHVFHYTYTTDSDSSRWPRKKNIIKALEEISKKAVAEDILVIFFAGHGATKTNSKNLYLLTAEASSASMTGVEKQVAISFEELKAWMQKIKANKQVIILDACFSGLAVDNLSPLTTKRALPDDQIRAVEDLKDKTGTYLLSASSAVQPGYEASAYNQGILTYCLLSSIKMGDALKENKFIDITQWFNSTAKNVKVMARDLGKVQDPRILGNASFNVGMVDKEILDGIRLSGKKKVFGRSSFVKQGIVPSDNQLELSKSINKALNEQSIKGRESLIAFAPDNILADAYTIVGNYEIIGNQVTAKCYLLMGKDEKPIFEFQKSGLIDRPDDLAREIVEAAQKYFNK